MCDECDRDECTCDDPTTLRALWRKLEGKRVFTGIVTTDGNAFRKLHDPTGPLDGDAHEMHLNEFFAEMSMYDDSTIPRAQKPIGKKLVCMQSKTEKHVADGEEEPDAWFPFDLDASGNVDPSSIRVRSDDRVKVKLVGHVRHKGNRVPLCERFWCHVVSVTAAGIITAVPTVKLNWSPVGPDTPVYFPVTRVMSMNRGKHWD